MRDRWKDLTIALEYEQAWRITALEKELGAVLGLHGGCVFGVRLFRLLSSDAFRRLRYGSILVVIYKALRLS